MSKRQLVAETLAVKLHDTETAIDDAIIKLGELFALLPEMRREAGLSAVMGQDVFAAAGEAASRLGQARGDIVRTHNALEALRLVLRLQPTRAGGPVQKPEGLASTRSGLAIVGGQRAA